MGVQRGIAFPVPQYLTRQEITGARETTVRDTIVPRRYAVPCSRDIARATRAGGYGQQRTNQPERLMERRDRQRTDADGNMDRGPRHGRYGHRNLGADRRAKQNTRPG